MVLDVTAKDKSGKELFTAKKTYFEIGADIDGDMRHGAWQIKQIFDLTLQPKDTKKETFLMPFNKETDEANLDVTVTYCLSAKKCDVIHKYSKKLVYTVDQ